MCQSHPVLVFAEGITSQLLWFFQSLFLFFDCNLTLVHCDRAELFVVLDCNSRKNPLNWLCNSSNLFCLTAAALPSSNTFSLCLRALVSVNFSTATGSWSRECNTSIICWCMRENLVVVLKFCSIWGRVSIGITLLYISSQIAATRRICKLQDSDCHTNIQIIHLHAW